MCVSFFTLTKTVSSFENKFSGLAQQIMPFFWACKISGDFTTCLGRLKISLLLPETIALMLFCRLISQYLGLKLSSVCGSYPLRHCFRSLTKWSFLSLLILLIKMQGLVYSCIFELSLLYPQFSYFLRQVTSLCLLYRMISAIFASMVSMIPSTLLISERKRSKSALFLLWLSCDLKSGFSLALN